MDCKISVKADPTTWTVDDNRVECPDANFTLIQEAINAASDGDIIYVYNGTYYEKVIVNKIVSLIGEDRDSTIINGGSIGSVITIMADNVNISGFTIQCSGPKYDDAGIYVDHHRGNGISHNTITDNFVGIALHFSSNNVVSDNTISLNNHDGIRLYSSSNNVVSGNTISSNNDVGIGFYSSSNNVASGNAITNNYDGIGFYSSSNNVVSGNAITNNYDGIYFTLDSENNIIYCNNFNNTHQVECNSRNIWNVGDEGNYWSDYTGQDLNANGIGDTKIPHLGVDYYPLMGMFSDFTVALERETYHITTICNSTITEFKFEIGAETGNEIIRFNVTGKDGTVGFCRVRIPTEFMNYPFIVLVGVEEIVPTLLDVPNETYVYLYFTYIHSSHTITIISSKTLHLYNELLDEYAKLQIDLYNLNTTYYGLLNNYSVLLGNYSQLQKSYHELNNSYQEHLLDYSKNEHNIRNLMYIFAATTAIFIITIIYLSNHAHGRQGQSIVRAQQHKKLMDKWE